RLPVIEVEEVQEVAAAKIVLTGHLGHAGGDRVRTLVAEDRVPAVAVSQLAEPGRDAASDCRKVELRISGVPLVADALVVGPGNPEHVEAEIPRVEVR